ncbi:MAG TPA: hypothetical protein VKD90_24250 [Gemmataceae bacterium]|nr:hypothetical protein [Gemmataceae bacterium]
MNELTPSTAHAFLKRFQLRGGRLTRFRLQKPTADGATAEVRLAARDTENDQRVRLRLVFDGVEEYRFQRRPGPARDRLNDVQVGFFGNLVYLNLDAFPEDGPPKVMDFRASDCFLAGRTARWEVVQKTADGAA